MTIYNRYNKLQVAKSVSVAGSIVGIIASFVTNQVVYASASIGIALSLNMLNRSKLSSIEYQAKLQQDIKAVYKDVEDVKNKFFYLENSLMDKLYKQVDVAPINESIKELQEKTAKLDSIGSSKAVDAAGILSLEEKLAYLQEQINNIDNLFNDDTKLSPYKSISEYVDFVRKTAIILQHEIVPFKEQFDRYNFFETFDKLNNKVDNLSKKYDDNQRNLMSLYKNLDIRIKYLHDDYKSLIDIAVLTQNLEKKFNSQQSQFKEIQQDIANLYKGASIFHEDNNKLKNEINKITARLDKLSNLSNIDLNT